MASIDYRPADSAAPGEPPLPGHDRDAGKTKSLDLQCSGCGYGIAWSSIPPRCPMCGSTAWTLGRI